MYNFEKVKILVVDDEAMLREILVESFTMYGALVDEAPCGNSAFEKLHNNYDVVISDVRMPECDGITFITKIKNQNKYKPKIFICTAFNDLTYNSANELNILKVFNKPFDLDSLLSAVHESLNKN